MLDINFICPLEILFYSVKTLNTILRILTSEEFNNSYVKRSRLENYSLFSVYNSSSKIAHKIFPNNVVIHLT